MKNIIKTKILNNIFIVSKQPVLFRDLLEANSLYNEGMLIDGAKLNFKFNHRKTYQIYAMFCIVILLPLLIATHYGLSKVDSHISILSTIFVTSLVFIGFDLFKVWARKEISHELIKKAWSIHFPYFAYEKYSSIAEEIYNEAVKYDISRKDLEPYMLERLLKHKSS